MCQAKFKGIIGKQRRSTEGSKNHKTTKGESETIARGVKEVRANKIEEYERKLKESKPYGSQSKPKGMRWQPAKSKENERDY